MTTESSAGKHGVGSIVGVDGSAGSIAALQWAAAHADRLGQPRPVMAWHFPWAAYTPSPFGGVAVPPADDMHDATEAALEKLLARSGVTGLGDPIVGSGDAAHVLMSAADNTGAAAIVVGTRGRGGFASLLLGSTSSHCADHSHVPVVIVPESPAPTTAPASETIVVGIDGSAGSETALRFALDFARPTDRIRAIGAWQMPVVTGYETYVIETIDLAEATSHMLETTVERVARPGDHAVEREVHHGDARVILREASSDADVLIVGARGAGLLTQLLVGSVAHAVIRHPECPTILVPPASRSAKGES